MLIICPTVLIHEQGFCMWRSSDPFDLYRTLAGHSPHSPQKIFERDAVYTFYILCHVYYTSAPFFIQV